MKKKLLFIIPGLASGGAEKSLVNLLNAIDYGRFEVDLALMSSKGIFMEAVPETVNRIALPENFSIFSRGMASSVMGFLKKGRLDLVYHRLAFASVHRSEKNLHRAEQKAWKHLQKAIGILPGHYDAAVGYLEKTAIYFCVDCVSAAKKIGFIRTDYTKLGLDITCDEKYFAKLDYLCANGHESLRILESVFPKLKDRLKVVLNVVSPALIRQMADAPIDWQPQFPTLLSIGRLEQVKGFDLSVAAAAILKQRNIEFRWLVIGEGVERRNLEAAIEANGLSGKFILLGEKANPYPYFKMADVYVQTSRFEGRSSTINEAKIMARPIVVTDFDSVFELLEDGKDALIVGKDPEAIANGIEKMLADAALRQRLVASLEQTPLGTEAEIEKFYALIA